jgi:hypothetical protein
LGLELVEARQAGYDAIHTENGAAYRLQIKGRCVLPGPKPSQRLGKIDINKEFDGVLLVLMNESFNATAIYEANKRGALGVSKFKAIARQVWPQDSAGRRGR